MRFLFTILVLVGASISLLSIARADFDFSPTLVNSRIVPNAYDDDAAELVPRQFVFAYNFNEDPANPFAIEDPGIRAFNGSGLPQGSTLSFDFLGDLRYWNGSGSVQFTPVPTGESLTLSAIVGSGSATAGTGTGFQSGFTVGTLALGGSMHRHLQSTLNAGAEQIAPAEGIYLAEVQLRSSDATIKNSLPIFVLYNNGLDLTTLDAAKTWVEDHFLPLGDFDRDGELTSADLPAMLGALTDLDSFRAAHQLSTDDLLAFGDMNGDGVISNADIQPLLNLLAENEGGGSVNAVPEPAALVLFGIGMVAILHRKRQNRVASDRGLINR